MRLEGGDFFGPVVGLAALRFGDQAAHDVGKLFWLVGQPRAAVDRWVPGDTFGQLLQLLLPCF